MNSSPTTDLRLSWCSHKAAKYAVDHWHYLRKMPSGKLARIGAWEEGQFIGAIVFGSGSNKNLVRPYGLTCTEGCELVRVALRKHISPVSKMLSVAVKMVKRTYPGLRLIVSFADPDQGHYGGIYQASNWIYAGTTAAHKYPVINGQLVHPRTLSDLIKSGRIKSRAEVRSVEMSERHRYLYPLDKSMKKRIQQFRQPYPKRVTSIDSDAPASQAGEGGASPTVTLPKHSSILGSDATHIV